jgi:hypothetical protein
MKSVSLVWRSEARTKVRRLDILAAVVVVTLAAPHLGAIFTVRR